jgi:hypothetical protein
LFAGIGLLLVCIGPIREWVARELPHLVGPSKTGPTIFLAALSITLLSLWISSEVRLYRLRQRVRRDMLTIGDLASREDLIRALNELK